jgi:hypothetical protein
MLPIYEVRRSRPEKGRALLIERYLCRRRVPGQRPTSDQTGHATSVGKRSSSHLTRRWRKADSNRWSHLRLNGSDAGTRDEQIAMSPLRRLDKQSLERADAVRGRLDQSASSRPTSSRGRSTTTTASVPPGNLCGDGSVRSTKHIPTRVRASSPHIAAERLSAQHGIRP